MNSVLTIAGSDSSGGAGIQADLKSMLANGVYGMSAITALTAQNTTGVYGVVPVEPEFLKSQIDAVFVDILPAAVKTGMIATPAQVKIIADCLTEYKADNIVIDPVMIATSGAELANKDVILAMIKYLFPISMLITPNIPEASVLLKMAAKTAYTDGTLIDDNFIEKAAEEISNKFNCNVLIKGGHRTESCDDFLYEKSGMTHWFRGRRVANENVHGIGCTLSSAIAANLAKGYDLQESIRLAKAYLTGILNSGLNLGKDSGPLDHGYLLHHRQSCEPASLN